MGEGAGIEDHSVGPLAHLVQPVDERTFVVRLEGAQRDTELARSFGH
jgi:hypothetical protein